MDENITFCPMRTKNMFLTSAGAAGVRLGTGFKPCQHTTHDIYDGDTGNFGCPIQITNAISGMKRSD